MVKPVNFIVNCLSMVNSSNFLVSLVMMFSMKEKYETIKISSVFMLKISSFN